MATNETVPKHKQEMKKCKYLMIDLSDIIPKNCLEELMKLTINNEVQFQ